MYPAIISLLAAALIYVLVVRPILIRSPKLSAVFDAEATFKEKCQAKLTGFKTKASAMLLGIAGFLVWLYDTALPLIAGQDLTPLTAELPSWSVPVGLMAISALFTYLHAVTANPPQIVLATNDLGEKAVVGVIPALR